MISICYYSDSSAPQGIRRRCAATLAAALDGRHAEFACVTWDGAPPPLPRGEIWTDRKRSFANLFRQIIRCLEIATCDVAFLCEHDVLYPPDYFPFMADEVRRTGKLAYNRNLLYAQDDQFFATLPYQLFLSNLCAPREKLLAAMRERLVEAEADQMGHINCCEPTVDAIFISAPTPTIDIRHGGNFTGQRQPPKVLTHPIWGEAKLITSETFGISN